MIQNATIAIDPEFQAMIPPLAPGELSQLTRSLLAEGCRERLVVWGEEGVLLDGHHRFGICQQHGVSFETQAMSFASRDAAKAWVIRNQFARRNLTPFQKAELALKLKPLVVATAKEKQRASGGAVVQKSAEPPITTRGQLAEIAGVSHDTIGKAEYIRERADAETLSKLRRGHAGMSINRVHVKLRSEEVSAAAAPPPPLPEGKYRVLLADPPWHYQNSRLGCGGAANHYPSMTIEKLCKLPIEDLAADNSVLFLWCTVPLLFEVPPVISAWGFQYRTSFVWDKVRHNCGYYSSVRHELLLLCVRGSCLPDTKKLIDSVQTIERTRKHSQKPEQFREIIDTLYTWGPKIELFARRQVPGWDAWGNEAPTARAEKAGVTVVQV